jgi:sec-independent protein translocase protein TatB
MFPEDRFLEILIIGALALIVIGPKDLPVVMRRVGQFVGRMRAMAAEFRASFDELARQSELDELRREVDALRVAQHGAYSAPAPTPAAAPEMTASVPTEPAPAPAEPETSAKTEGEPTP